MTFGSFILSFSTVLRLAMQFAFIPIFARYLSPEDYGIVAFAIPFVFAAGTAFLDGFTQFVLYEQPNRMRDDTIFWTSAVFSILAMLALLALSSVLFFVPHLAESSRVVLILSIIPVLSGLSIVPAGFIRREARFGLFSIIDLAAAFLSSVVALVLVMQHYGYLGLLAQQITLWSVKLVLTWVFSGYRPRLAFNTADFRRMFPVVARINLSGLLNMSMWMLGNFSIGLVLGSTALGVYSISYQVIVLPDMIITGPITFGLAALFKARPRLQSQYATYVSAYRLGLFLCIPMFVGLYIAAPSFVAVLLGSKWEAAVPVIRMLCPLGAALCTLGIQSAFYNAQGRARELARVNSIYAICVGVLALASVHGGLPLYISALTGAVVLLNLVLTFGLERSWPAMLRFWNRVLPLPLAAAATVGIAAYAAQAGFGRSAVPGVEFAVVLLTCAVVLLAFAAIVAPKMLRVDLRRVLQRASAGTSSRTPPLDSAKPAHSSAPS